MENVSNRKTIVAENSENAPNFSISTSWVSASHPTASNNF